MLQRVQTIYLLLVEITLTISMYIAFLQNKSFLQSPSFIGFLISFILVIISIISFKNRSIQIKLNYIVILLIVIISGLSFYQSGILSGEKQFSKKDIEWLVPLISIVFLLTANKYIKRDEALVKSVDRIR